MNSSKFRRGKKVVTKNGKVLLQVLIPQDLYAKIVEIAPMVFGKYHGALSGVVEEALKLYLRSLELAHTKHANPPLSVAQEYNMFIKELQNLLGFLPRGIKTSTARKVMLKAFTRCKDERTQNKKLHTWYLMGYIKPLPDTVKPKNPKSWMYIPSIEIVAKEA